MPIPTAMVDSYKMVQNEHQRLIRDLKQQLSAAREHARKDITDLKKRNSKLHVKLHDMKKDCDQLKSQIKELKKELSKYKPRKLII